MLALEYSETVSVLLHRSMDDVWKKILFRGIISQPECSFLLCSVHVCLFSKSSQGQWQWLNIDVIMVRLEMWVTCCGLVYSSPGCLGRKWKKNVGLHLFDFKKCRKYIFFFIFHSKWSIWDLFFKIYRMLSVGTNRLWLLFTYRIASVEWN